MEQAKQPSLEEYERYVAKIKCEQDPLWFTRYFFKKRNNAKFIINWHHRWIADELEMVATGETENLVINVSPGGTKTELSVINFIARQLALNPRARFLHLSYSDDLASLNSATTRDIITSSEFQELWPLKIGADTSSKKRWNIQINGQPAGGVYATAIGGQVTGFRAGYMTEGFSGAILLDDLLKPEEAFSRPKIDAANRRLVSTVKSRKANPKTPIILIMQRIAESDPVGFIKAGNLGGKWKHVVIPALLNTQYVKEHVPQKYWKYIDRTEHDDKGRFSYWPYKEKLEDLLTMERGEGSDASGSRVSKHVFNSQYQQSPVALGGNIIKGEYFERYSVLPTIKYRLMFADTAQKTKERNDFSVFGVYGLGENNKLYLLDLIRGKWEAPELQARAIAFWNKHKADESEKIGQLRKIYVEDKSSGTGLIQTLKLTKQIPIEGIERNKDKLTRVMDGLPYLESRQVCVPAEAPFTNDFIAECEAFTSDDSHDYDDQIDPLLDAIEVMLSSSNKLKQWEKLAKEGTK